MATSVLNLAQNHLSGGVLKPRTKTIVRRQLANPARLNKIRKDLFGPVDREETKKLFAQQMEQHQRIAAQRWNFDFANETPLVCDDTKYIWERVPPMTTGGLSSPPPPPPATITSPPQPVITLSSAAHVREINSAIMSSPASSSSSELDSSLSESGIESEKSHRLRQTKMTDFLKEKKRKNPLLGVQKKDFKSNSTSSKRSKLLSTCPSGSESAPPPAKRIRTDSSAS